MVSSSWASHAARAVHPHWVQYSIESLGTAGSGTGRSTATIVIVALTAVDFAPRRGRMGVREGMGGTMRPLVGQTILITGATDGLGKALAIELAHTGATVLIHGRDDERGKEVVGQIERMTGNDRLCWYKADLADLTQVAEVAEQIAADHPYLDALVNNAGIGPDVPGGPSRQESVDGHELRFAVNYLAGFSLTRRLLPALRRAARERGSARVVLVSSAGQAPIDVDDLMLRQHYDCWTAYCRSKLAQVMFAFDLADEVAGWSVTANALHPATYMPTKIVPRPISTLAEGVEATARLVTDPALERVSGRYFDGLHEAQPNRQAFDPEVRRRLRAASYALTGLRP